MQQDNWDDLRFVLAIGRSRSIVEASRKLEVNQTTVGRRLEQCEARFGTRLFERTRGALRPTDAGNDLLAHAERVEREVLAAQASLSGLDQKAEGTVRLTAVPLLINHILAPALPDLLAEHPNLHLELVADARDLSLTKREADFALRLARPSREAQILAQKIGELTYGVYGSAKPQADQETWIVYEPEMAHLPHAKWLAAQCEEHGRSVAVNDAETIVAFLRSGFGRSILPSALAARLDGLVGLDVSPAPPAREVWLLSHPDQKNLVRMQTVAAWVKEAVQKTLEQR